MKNLIKILLILIITIILVYLFPTLKNILLLILDFLLPFIIGFTIAFLLVPIVDYLEKKKFNRKVVAILILAIFIAIIVSLFIFVLPILVKEISKLIENFPEYYGNIVNIIIKTANKLNIELDENKLNINSIINIIGIKYEEIFNFFTKIIQWTFSYLFALVLSIILSLYFLIDYNQIVNKIKEYFIKKEEEDTIVILRKLKKNMYSYLGGVLLVMVFLILISTVCFFIIGINLPLLWGIIIGLTNIIPYIGPYIGGFIVAIFTLGSMPNKIIPVIAIIVVLQLIESNFITPKVESKTVKVHPILAIFSVALLGKILGIFGMILAIPIVSSIQIVKNHKKYN